jgi:hypothetical protein
MSRIEGVFGALVVAQTAHSIEEYFGRLWDSFPPARFLTGLISSDRELGFLVINVGLLAFGVWCLLWPIRRNWPSASVFAWLWVVVEIINGIGHPAWSLWRGRYTPGVLTAPILLVLSIYLGYQLRQVQRTVAPAR